MATNNVAVPPAAPKRRKRVILLILLILGAAGAGTYWYATRDYEGTDDAFIDGHIIQLAPQVSGVVKKVCINDNVDVKKGDLLVEIDPRDFEARLAQAQAAFAVAKARKHTADVNVDLVSATAKADLDVASAGLEIAKSGVTSAQTQVGFAQSRQVEAEAMSASAAAALEQSRADAGAFGAEATRSDADAKRYEQLFKAGSATSQQLDNARAAATSAAAKLESAKKKITAAEAQLREAQAGIVTAGEAVKQAQAALSQAQAGVVEAQARIAQANIVKPRMESSVSQQEGATADIAQLEAAVRQADLQLSYTKIFATEDGRITRKSVEEGAYLQIGQAIAALVPADVWVTANYKETQLTLIRPGQPVTVKVDAYPGKEFQAKVDSIQRGAGARFSLLPPENATGNYVKVVQRVPVKITFDAGQLNHADYPLGPGMSVMPSIKVR
jgi:membrane fusion protein (multidrug efflux system)